ncbi:982_t:CDS:1, partial [Dentiscutata heterogama]
SMASLKKTNLTNDQCKQICLHKQQNLTITQSKLAKWAKKKFGLNNTPNQETFLHILGQKDKYLAIEDERSKQQ